MSFDLVPRFCPSPFNLLGPLACLSPTSMASSDCGDPATAASAKKTSDNSETRERASEEARKEMKEAEKRQTRDPRVEPIPTERRRDKGNPQPKKKKVAMVERAIYESLWLDSYIMIRPSVMNSFCSAAMQGARGKGWDILRLAPALLFRPVHPFLCLFSRPL